MTIRKKIKFLIFVYCLLATSEVFSTNKDLVTPPPIVFAQGQALYDQFPWAFTVYYGKTVNNPLIDILTFQKLNGWPEHVESIEIAHTFSPESGIRRFFCPLVGVVQLAGNFSIRNGKNEPTIYEFNPYLSFRWANFPWNHILVTSFAIGEGISYDTSYPAIEKRDNDNTKRLLNYLMLEAAFALPNHPQFQIAARIHHRSGAFGLYHAGNTGSNNIGIAIRYLF